MQAPGQVQRGSGEGSEGSREGLGGRSGRLWCRASSGSTGFRRRSQGSRKPWCKANRAPEKVPEKAWRKVSEKVGRLWCRARSSSTKFREKVPEKVWEALVQGQVRAADRVPEKASGEGLGEGSWKA